MSILFLSANLRAEKTTISFETNAICGMCIDRIEDACYALQGVKNVDVDLEGKTVSVTFNDAKTSEEAIKMAVADAGSMAETCLILLYKKVYRDVVVSKARRPDTLPQRAKNRVEITIVSTPLKE